MVHAIRFLEEEKPIFISVSDIPCITAGIVRSIAEFYDTYGKDGLSTWVPASIIKTCRGGMPYRERIDGIEACPAGINILRGDHIDEVQDEQALLLNEPRLAINVNTRSDLAEAESLLRRESTA
jgi:adenosylcobinamide-phosphate guanylyltransferase